MSEQKYIKVQFSELKDNDEFECYGDELINYDYPKICKCKKISDDRAQEIDGIYFYVSKNSYVFIPKK